jgi:hypothetical protein
MRGRLSRREAEFFDFTTGQKQAIRQALALAAAGAPAARR